MMKLEIITTLNHRFLIKKVVFLNKKDYIPGVVTKLLFFDCCDVSDTEQVSIWMYGCKNLKQRYLVQLGEILAKWQKQNQKGQIVSYSNKLFDQ